MSLFFVSINTCSLQLTKDVKPGGSESVKERRTKPVSTGTGLGKIRRFISLAKGLEKFIKCR